MVLRKTAKFILNNIESEKKEETDKTKKLINKIIDDSKLYKKNKSFVMRLIQYYAEKKQFTQAQLTAVERLVYG